MLTRGITTPFYFRLSGLPAEVRPHFLPAWLEMGDGVVDAGVAVDDNAGGGGVGHFIPERTAPAQAPPGCASGCARRGGVIASAHFSLELGGPKQCGPTTANPVFDEEAPRWIREADVPGALARSWFEQLIA